MEVAPLHQPQHFSQSEWVGLRRANERLTYLLDHRPVVDDTQWLQDVQRALAGIAAYYDDGWRGE